MENKLDNMQQGLDQFRIEQGNMQTALNGVVEEQGKMDDRIRYIELNPPTIDIDQVKKDIIDQKSQNLSKSVNAQWETYLTEEIRDKEKCLIITGNPEYFHKFCSEQLKMNKDDACKIEVKQIRVQKGGAQQGKGKAQKEGGKNKDTVCIELGHISQRNM